MTGRVYIPELRTRLPYGEYHSLTTAELKALLDAADALHVLYEVSQDDWDWDAVALVLARLDFGDET